MLHSQVVVKEPPNMALRVATELASSLDEHTRELLCLLGFSEFLCCLTVVKNQRTAGRISVSANISDRVLTLLRHLGLSCHRSTLDLFPLPDLVKGNLVNHHAQFVPRGTRENAQAIIYFGVDTEFAEGAETAEQCRNHKLLASLFGYPDCCSEFYAHNPGQNEDRTAQSISDTGPFRPILNPLMPELYGIRLHFHFPCSPRCEASIAIATRNLQGLAEYAPSIESLGKLSCGIVLYGPQIGALLVTDYTESDVGVYTPSGIVAWPDSASVFVPERHTPRLNVWSAHRFQLGNTLYNDQAHFAAIFADQ
jgi:hypothetical protein